MYLVFNCDYWEIPRNFGDMKYHHSPEFFNDQIEKSNPPLYPHVTCTCQHLLSAGLETTEPSPPWEHPHPQSTQPETFLMCPAILGEKSWEYK